MDILVNINHAKKLGYCSKGVRAFFKKHNLDYSAFVKDGLPSIKLMQTNDLMAIKIVEVAIVQRK